MAEKLYFSKVESMDLLNQLFKCRAVVTFCHFEADEPTVDLLDRIFQGRENVLPAVTEIYDGYFERRHRSTLLPDITNLPPCLLQLVSLLRHCAATNTHYSPTGQGSRNCYPCLPS